MFNNRTFFRSTAIAAITLSGALSHTFARADQLPPLILHELPVDAVAGEDFKLQATVRDDGGIRDVVLNFKLPSAAEFDTRTMIEAGNDLFETQLLGSELSEQGLDYYIEASDEAGNIESRGFDFDPLRLNVAAAPAVAQDSEEFSIEPESDGINWLYVVGGVLAAGVLAAALGDGGDDPETSLTFVDPIPQ